MLRIDQKIKQILNISGTFLEMSSEYSSSFVSGLMYVGFLSSGLTIAVAKNPNINALIPNPHRIIPVINPFLSGNHYQPQITGK